MKILIVEDDFASRKLMQHIMAAYGECDVAVDGREALRAVKLAWSENAFYELICLDIMLPEMDGQQVLKEVRRLEKERGVAGSDAVKVIMTTVLNDSKNVMEAFRSQCEGYVLKPVTREKIEVQLRSLNIVK
jgi:two-component system chemotaxis response regulator CheY